MTSARHPPVSRPTGLGCRKRAGRGSSDQAAGAVESLPQKPAQTMDDCQAEDDRASALRRQRSAGMDWAGSPSRARQGRGHTVAGGAWSPHDRRKLDSVHQTLMVLRIRDRAARCAEHVDMWIGFIVGRS